MKKIITVIPGDGIGPEVIAQAVKVLNKISAEFNHKFIFDYALMGAEAIDKTGVPLPPETIKSCKKSDATLFGAIGHPKYDNDPNAKVRPEQGLLQLRKELQIFANIRPVNSYPSLHHLSPLKPASLKGVDFVIYRELTGGIYFGKKSFDRINKKATDLCEYSVYEIERIAHLAFSHAQKRKKILTLIDKANVLETSRLWRQTVKELSPQYPDVNVNYMFVDNAAMQIILNPGQFDIILTDNMFGDILSDEASVLTGSLGLLPSASVGENTALFEPIHGSYPQAAGKNIANPVGAILSAAMMLEYFNLHKEAGLIKEAVNYSLQNNRVTKDINPTDFKSTDSIGDLIVAYLEKREDIDFNFNNIVLGQSTII